MSDFKKLLDRFPVSQEWKNTEGELESLPGVDDAFRHATSSLGARMYGDGIYQVFDSREVVHERGVLRNAFPGVSKKGTPFATDWLGRYFVADATNKNEAGAPQVTLFDPGAGEAYKVPCTIKEFHQSELLEAPEELLEVSLYQDWCSSRTQTRSREMCIGYKKPLFLGGLIEIDNLELIDREVQVELCGQLWHKMRSLKPGQAITIKRVDGGFDGARE